MAHSFNSLRQIYFSNCFQFYTLVFGMLLRMLLRKLSYYFLSLTYFAQKL